MNQDVVAGPSPVFFMMLVALLSGITLVLWQLQRLRKARVKARIRRPLLPRQTRHDR
jgi:cytochrome oxidase assembly protein ShyY1